MILTIGFICPPTIHFKSITKCDRIRCPSSKDSQEVTVDRRVGIRVASAPVSYGFKKMTEE